LRAHRLRATANLDHLIAPRAGCHKPSSVPTMHLLDYRIMQFLPSFERHPAVTRHRTARIRSISHRARSHAGTRRAPGFHRPACLLLHAGCGRKIIVELAPAAPPE
jgi:hypothetical protein